MASATVGRGLELLTVLFDARCPLEVSAIAGAMGATRSATYRLLRQLELSAFVSRDCDGRWCLPAGGVMTLSARLIARLHLRAAARPVIERIAARSGETVTLNVRNREHRMRLDAVAGRPPRLPLPLGETLPLGAGASGRVILAFLPGAGHDAGLRAQLARIRRRGYLVTDGDRLPGLAALAVPVFGSAGISGAVSVVGPAARWGPEAMERAAPWVRMECAALSASLGSLPPLD